MGVVLNRASEAPVAEVVPGLAGLADGDEIVRVGGPVSPDAVVALGEFGDPEESGAPVIGGLGTLDPERANESLRRMRVYAGYAGWSAGQLDCEVEEGAWIVEAASPEDPFRDDDIWSAALERKGGGYRLLATMPADPSLN
jgi:putative transcriptional regulator